MKNGFSCKVCMGKMASTNATSRGYGMFVRPIYGGSTSVLLGVAPTARPPFLGEEQLDAQALYAVGQGMGNMTSRSLGNIENKLAKITLKPVKSLRKNIKMNF
jgi:hypothetical protein